MTAGPAAVLIGPPGAGKSTTGPLLADLLGTSFLDTDEIVAAEAGKPVGDIFVEDGEDAFRALERAAVARALASHPGVLGLGGGAVLDEGTRKLLAGHRLVYLRTGFAAAAQRVGLGRPRPLLAANPRAQLKELLEQRLPIYESLAWVTADTDDREPAEIAGELAATLAAEIAAESGEGAGTGDPMAPDPPAPYRPGGTTPPDPPAPYEPGGTTPPDPPAP